MKWSCFINSLRLQLIETYNTRRHPHRKTSQRMELAAEFSQNIGPKPFNKLPEHKRKEQNYDKFITLQISLKKELFTLYR